VAAMREAVEDGEPTVATVGRTGFTPLEPLVTVTVEGKTAFYPNCSQSVAGEVTADAAEGAVGDSGYTTVTIGHEFDETTFPSTTTTDLDVGVRRLLGECGWLRPTSRVDYRVAGGFVDADPETVFDAATEFDGRGWGDWCQDEPIDGAANRARQSSEGVAVVVNAHGSAADSLLVESVPFAVLEGADLLAGAVGADRVVVYASETDGTAVVRARSAVANYPDPSAEIDVVTGPPVYRAAEPTMALEAVEGNHRLEARLRKPGRLPRLDGRPTLVHTARTLVHLAYRVREGPDRAYLYNTRLVTVTGDVETPATVELPEHQWLETALDAVSVDGEFKAASVGGRFGGLAPSLDVGAESDTLVDEGLGTEGVVEVLADDTCLLEFVGKRARLAADTNCGRCVPCREGSTQLAELLRDVYDGDYDESAVRELCRVMDRSSVCAFGVDAARPARTAIDRFDQELRAHADGRCPAGTCFDEPG